jgi:hypothetical protein
MILPIVFLVLLLLSLTGVTVTEELVVAQQQSAAVNAQDRASLSKILQAYVLTQARAAEYAYITNGAASHDQSAMEINGGGVMASYFTSTLVNPCPTCSESASVTFTVGTPFAGYENLAVAPNVTSTTTQNVNDPLEVGTMNNYGCTGSGPNCLAGNYSWKANVQCTITLTPQGGGPSTMRVENIMVRVFGSSPYADIVGDDQGTNTTILAGDTSTQVSGSVDTGVHAYNVCTDASNTAACAGTGTPQNDYIYSYSSTAAAANQTW